MKNCFNITITKSDDGQRKEIAIANVKNTLVIKYIGKLDSALHDKKEESALINILPRKKMFNTSEQDLKSLGFIWFIAVSKPTAGITIFSKRWFVTTEAKQGSLEKYNQK